MQIQTDNLKQGLIWFFGVFWKNLFLILVAFIILAMLASVLIFWQVYINRQEADAPILPVLNINQKLLDDFFIEWEARETDFEKALDKDHDDPFSGNLLVESTE